MCGFTGVYAADSREIDEKVLVAMNTALSHRGPDESGFHYEPGIGLGHRRLSIIDISTGQQPLYNENGSVVVVFNGEIYNFQEIARELKSVGHIFKTHSDTEVIVHSWEEWGAECLNKFRGMFAFALWDRNRKQLLLARDRLGIKPLYYGTTADGTLLFGSELKALMIHPDFKKEIQPEAIEEYFAFGYIPEPRSLYKNTWKLSPGHYLLFEQGNGFPAQRQYWDVTFTEDNRKSAAELQTELIERIREAVRIRLIAEVPLGAFLSGGVDSSAIVATMAGLIREPVNTCSISFNDPAFNEAEYARRVAGKYKTSHRERQVNSDDFSLIDRLASLYDEPFADSSAMPTYRVCQLARENVTVALSGDGGDENFAGYKRYTWHLNEERFRSLIPLAVRKPVFGALGRCYPNFDRLPRAFRGKTTFQALARDSVMAYYHTVSALDDETRNRLFGTSLRRELQGYSALEVFRRYSHKNADASPLGLIQYLDLKTYLPGDILTKVDRASMAHALEVRVPLLDHHLVEWVATLPPELKMNGGMGKFLFKKAYESYLPSDVLYRKKMGFAVPVAKWFRSELRENLAKTLEGDVISSSGIFNQKEVFRIYSDHQSGKRDYSVALWALLMFSKSLGY